MFTWNPQKAISNFDKHKVSFEEAATCFADTEGLEVFDVDHSADEDRFKRLALSSECRICLVIYTFRRYRDGKEKIRIISARQATQKERQVYER